MKTIVKLVYKRAVFTVKELVFLANAVSVLGNHTECA